MPSTAIRRFSYDEETRILFVTFIDGDIYAYRGVERQTHQAFKDALSKGGFFARRIRGRYPYAKLPPGARALARGTHEADGRSHPADHPRRAGARHERM